MVSGFVCAGVSSLFFSLAERGRESTKRLINRSPIPHFPSRIMKIYHIRRSRHKGIENGWKIESPTPPQQDEQKVHGSLWGGKAWLCQGVQQIHKDLRSRLGPHRGEPQ